MSSESTREDASAFMNIYDTALVQALKKPAFAARLDGAGPAFLDRIRRYDEALDVAAGLAACGIAAAPSFLAAELVFHAEHIGTPSILASFLAVASLCAAMWAYRSTIREVRGAFPDGVPIDRDGMPVASVDPLPVSEKERRGSERSAYLVRWGGICREATASVLGVGAVFVVISVIRGGEGAAAVLGCALDGGLLAIAGAALRRAGVRALVGSLADDPEKQG